MRPIYLLAILIFTLISCGKKKDTWVVFYDNNKELMGFKNASGKVMISPKFMGTTVAKKFDDVVAVMEGKDYKMYYMLKNGRKFGRDSLYVFDFQLDCESEGFIRYKIKDRIGMYNALGKPVIPAQYNNLTPFKNGLSIGLKNAVKVHDDIEHEGCDHWYWQGGKQYLINIKNEVLVENLDYKEYYKLDLYSLEIANTPTKDTCRVNFKAVNGKYYSFVDNEKLFNQFLKSEIVDKLSEDALKDASYKDLIYWNEKDGWIHKPSSEYIHEHWVAIKKSLQRIKPGGDYWITSAIFTPIPDDMIKDFDDYYDNCGNLNDTRHPVMSVIINYKTNNDLTQDSFDFIKTGDGYKLLTLNLRSENVK